MVKLLLQALFILSITSISRGADFTSLPAIKSSSRKACSQIPLGKVSATLGVYAEKNKVVDTAWLVIRAITYIGKQNGDEKAPLNALISVRKIHPNQLFNIESLLRVAFNDSFSVGSGEFDFLQAFAFGEAEAGLRHLGQAYQKSGIPRETFASDFSGVLIEVAKKHLMNLVLLEQFNGIKTNHPLIEVAKFFAGLTNEFHKNDKTYKAQTAESLLRDFRWQSYPLSQAITAKLTAEVKEWDWGWSKSEDERIRQVASNYVKLSEILNVIGGFYEQLGPGPYLLAEVSNRVTSYVAVTAGGKGDMAVINFLSSAIDDNLWKEVMGGAIKSGQSNFVKEQLYLRILSNGPIEKVHSGMLRQFFADALYEGHIDIAELFYPHLSRDEILFSTDNVSRNRFNDHATNLMRVAFMGQQKSVDYLLSRLSKEEVAMVSRIKDPENTSAAGWARWSKKPDIANQIEEWLSQHY